MCKIELAANRTRRSLLWIQQRSDMISFHLIPAAICFLQNILTTTWPPCVCSHQLKPFPTTHVASNPLPRGYDM